MFNEIKIIFDYSFTTGFTKLKYQTKNQKKIQCQAISKVLI